MTDRSELNALQQSFVRFYCTGLTAPHAAKKAGYKPSYCRKASKLLKHRGIVAAIEDSQATLRESEGYGQEQAVAELNRLIKGALGAKNPNHMAAANLMGLKLKVFGLVKDRLEIVPVDLTGALLKAESRVLNVSPASTQITNGVSGRSVCWAPRTPGDPAPSDPA